MSLQTFIPPIPPSPGTTVTSKPKLFEAEFGDGYTQTTRAGINHIRREISLEWERLLPEHSAEIADFLRSHGGDTSFYYTPSDDPAPIKWTCKEWSERRNENGLRSVSCTFIESFTLEV